MIGIVTNSENTQEVFKRLSESALLGDSDQCQVSTKDLSTILLAYTLELNKNKVPKELIKMPNLERPTEDSLLIVVKRELCRWNSKKEWIDNSICDFVNSKVRESNYIAVNSNGLVCRTSHQLTQTEKDNAFPVIAYELN